MSAIADVADITDPGNRAAGKTDARQDTLKFAEAALVDSKREGLLLAVRARWVALAVTAVTLPIINPKWDVPYYVLMLGLFALIGWAQLKVGKAERSVPELILIFCDLLLMTFLTVVPNPFSTVDWPIAMQYRFDSFMYFFVFLATATLAYSWRTVVAMGFWTWRCGRSASAGCTCSRKPTQHFRNGCGPPSAPTSGCSISSTPHRLALAPDSSKSPSS